MAPRQISDSFTIWSDSSFFLFFNFLKVLGLVPGSCLLIWMDFIISKMGQLHGHLINYKRALTTSLILYLFLFWNSYYKFHLPTKLLTGPGWCTVLCKYSGCTCLCLEPSTSCCYCGLALLLAPSGRKLLESREKMPHWDLTTVPNFPAGKLFINWINSLFLVYYSLLFCMPSLKKTIKFIGVTFVNKIIWVSSV